MPVKIIKASNIGFCMGVRRAIDIISDVADRQGGVETLGALVHNQQVLKKLAQHGVRITDDVSDIKGKIVVISAHGVGPRNRIARYRRHRYHLPLRQARSGGGA
jgi:4-hydroxy-3-methylbut-2-enyl diphosphate reductase